MGVLRGVLVGECGKADFQWRGFDGKEKKSPPNNSGCATPFPLAIRQSKAERAKILGIGRTMGVLEDQGGVEKESWLKALRGSGQNGLFSEWARMEG